MSSPTFREHNKFDRPLSGELSSPLMEPLEPHMHLFGTLSFLSSLPSTFPVHMRDQPLMIVAGDFSVFVQTPYHTFVSHRPDFASPSALRQYTHRRLLHKVQFVYLWDGPCSWFRTTRRDTVDTEKAGRVFAAGPRLKIQQGKGSNTCLVELFVPRSIVSTRPCPYLSNPEGSTWCTASSTVKWPE